MSRSARVLRWLGLGVIAAIAFAYVQPVRSYMATRDEVAEQSAELRALSKERDDLRRKLDHAGTDAFVEREARALGLVRPGERLYVITGIERWKRARVR